MDWAVDQIDVRPHIAVHLPEEIYKDLHGFMALLEPAEHVIEMTVVYAELELDVFLEAIDGHRLWSLLELLEEFVEIGVMPYLVIVVCMAVGVVEVDESELLTWIVVFYVLQDLLVAAGNALCVHVRSRPALKAVSVRLQGYLVLPILLQQQIPQMILIIDCLEDLSATRIDEFHTGLNDGIVHKFGLPPSVDAAGIGGQSIDVLGCGGEAHSSCVYICT